MAPYHHRTFRDLVEILLLDFRLFSYQAPKKRNHAINCEQFLWIVQMALSTLMRFRKPPIQFHENA